MWIDLKQLYVCSFYRETLIVKYTFKKIIQCTPHHPDMRDQSNLSELLIVVELLWNLFTRRHFIGISQCNLQWIPIQIINQIVIQHSLELSAHTYRGDDIRWAENGPCGM